MRKQHLHPGLVRRSATKMVTAVPQEIMDAKILPQIPIGRLGKPVGER